MAGGLKLRKTPPRIVPSCRKGGKTKSSWNEPHLESITGTCNLTILDLWGLLFPLNHSPEKTGAPSRNPTLLRSGLRRGRRATWGLGDSRPVA
jgi:hypothetical protein